MTNLTYNSLQLFVWLKDESINIDEFQVYPSSVDAQSYLPMGYKDQIAALSELEEIGYIKLDKSETPWRYKITEDAENSIKADLDIYGQDQANLSSTYEEELQVANG
jgi:hypothetical protein